MKSEKYELKAKINPQLLQQNVTASLPLIVAQSPIVTSLVTNIPAFHNDVVMTIIILRRPKVSTFIQYRQKNRTEEGTTHQPPSTTNQISREMQEEKKVITIKQNKRLQLQAT